MINKCQLMVLLAVSVFACLGMTAEIRLSSPTPPWLRLAAGDLAGDYQKVTGETIEVGRLWTSSEPGGPGIVIGSFRDEVFGSWLSRIEPAVHQRLDGKRESFVVRPMSADPEILLIAGSDDRGAMRGIYAVSREVLGVDPTYLWTGIEPGRKADLSWESISLEGGEPTFPVRGWFINDEDLLTGWIEGGGARYIDYPHYGTVVHPDAMAMVCETAVRLGFNMIIPASFLDIDNPPEERLVQEAAKRGLQVSMHHIQLLGVDAFAYFNYWKERGEKPLFSFYSEPARLEETWRHYAQRWARYPGVIWQLGLRGIGDRPMWMADPGTPQSDADRGKIISDAIALQKNIVVDVTGDPQPSFTTTLWAEGAALFKAGHLDIPDDVMIIFADNSAGRVWQDDFYNTERDPNRKYGVYFHHQLWGSGPHMVQGVSPAEQEIMFRKAVEHRSNDYAVLNVSCLREFVLGLNASSQTLLNTPGFDADRFLEEQCRFWFGQAGGDVAAAYHAFFDSYLENGRGVPYFLDGLLRGRGLNLIGAINKYLETGQLPEKKENASSKWARQHLADMNPPLPEVGMAVDMLTAQRGELAKAWAAIALAEDSVRRHCEASRLRFFRENLHAQWLILNGLTEWALSLEQAMASLRQEDRGAASLYVAQALVAWQQIEDGKGIVVSNPRWRTWYRGDTKMNLASAVERTRDCLRRITGSDGAAPGIGDQ